MTIMQPHRAGRPASPHSAGQPVQAAASLEHNETARSALDAAVCLATSACAQQPSAVACRSSPTFHAVADVIPDAASACTALPSSLLPLARPRTPQLAARIPLPAGCCPRPHQMRLLRTAATSNCSRGRCASARCPSAYSNQRELQFPPSVRHRLLHCLSHLCLHCTARVTQAAGRFYAEVVLRPRDAARARRCHTQSDDNISMDADRLVNGAIITHDEKDEHNAGNLRHPVQVKGRHGCQLQYDGRRWSGRRSRRMCEEGGRDGEKEKWGRVVGSSCAVEWAAIRSRSCAFLQAEHQ